MPMSLLTRLVITSLIPRKIVLRMRRLITIATMPPMIPTRVPMKGQMAIPESMPMKPLSGLSGSVAFSRSSTIGASMIAGIPASRY